MLEPQPIPVNYGPSVTDYVLRYVGDNPLLTELFLRRRCHGKDKYGVELCALNDRDPLVDALQEAIDLCLYLTQEQIEKEAEGYPSRRLSLAFAILHEIVAELAPRFVAA
jgi:hypothetical protein